MEGLVVVESTHKGMELEDAISKKEIKGRLIPTPESISSSCGLSLKFVWQDYSQVVLTCQEIGITKPLIYQKNNNSSFGWQVS